MVFVQKNIYGRDDWSDGGLNVLSWVILEYDNMIRIGGDRDDRTRLHINCWPNLSEGNVNWIFSWIIEG